MSLSRAAGPAAVAVTACVMAWLNVEYAMLAFTGVPHVDDWYVINRLAAYASGEAGLGHLLERHNGHPSLPARLAFLVSYRLQGLDLLTIRWGMLLIVAATAAVVAVSSMAALRPDSAREEAAQPGIVLAVPLAIALCTTLGQWEIYSLAMAIANAAVNLFALTAIFSMHFYLQRRHPAWLALAFVCAVMASLSMGQGSLAWIALGAMLVLHPERRRLLPLAGLVAAISAVAVMTQLAAASGAARPGLRSLEFGRSASAVIGLLGLPIMGQVRNALVPQLTMSFGAAVLVLGMLAGARVLRAGPAELRSMVPFLGCIAYGGASLALIVVGRQGFPIEAMLASRYVPIVAPVAVGLAGLLAAGARWNSAATHLLSAFTAVAFVGLLVTNREERAMAPHRGAAAGTVLAAMERGFGALDDRALGALLHSDETTVAEARRAAEFLRRNRLGPLRPG